jgi:branched-chain amino acid transport system substrate-binding protein
MQNTLRWSAVLTAMLLVLAACQSTGSGSPSAAASGSAAASVVSRGTIKIGVDLPQSGNEVANGEPTFRGVELAVKEANAAGGVGGYTVEINNQDDAVNGVHSPDQGATNARTLVADEQVVGVVGPFNSNVARAIIPITNEAGLAQCSPANTGVDLTKAGSEVYRPQKPDQRNYFRLAAPDDIQGPAMAKFDYNDLAARTVYIVDDTEAFGAGVADQFQAAFVALGGSVVKRDGQKYSADVNYTPLFDTAAALNPDVVYFGGTQVTGGGLARKQMVQAGMGAVPYTGPDGIADLGVGGGKGAFITLAGVENSHDVYGTVAGVHDLPTTSTFGARFKAEYGKDAGAYSGIAYACTQVLLQAIAASADAATDMAALRAAVRDYVFDPANEYVTELGTISFTERGDIKQAFISFYKIDPAAEGGKGGWVYIRQEAFEGN